MAPVSWVISQKGRPPFPVERRPNSLVCASFNPSLHLGKERVEASGSRRPGAMDSSVGSFSPRAPETVQVERRLAWRTIACPPKDQPRSLLRLLEQGPEVSLLLPSAQVECRLSSAPPIAWPYSPPRIHFLASVESRIAFNPQTSNSENGVPRLNTRLLLGLVSCRGRSS